MRCIVFAARDCPETFDEAERLAKLLPQTRLVDKLSAKLPDLLLIAEYDVVEPAAFVVVDESGVRYRRPSIPSLAEAEAAIGELRRNEILQRH